MNDSCRFGTSIPKSMHMRHNIMAELAFVLSRFFIINVINLSNDERGRLINAEWDTQFAKGDANTSYLAELRITCNDRVGLILEISRQLADDDISVKGFNVRTTKDLLAIMNVTIEIKTKEQLERVVTRLKNLKDVVEVERVSGLG